MAKVGDRVEVRLRGAEPGHGVGAVNSATDVAGVITIAPGKLVTIPGAIIDERGDNWLIKLDASFDGQDLILVPKSAQR